MKKIFLFLTLLMGYSLSLFAQNVNLTESELASILTNKWGINFALMGSEKINHMPGSKDFDFLFKDNGEFDLIEEDGTIRKGFWKYFSKDNYIELSLEGKVTSRITSVNRNKLIMILVSEKGHSAKLKNVEIHFKPI